MVTHAVTHTQSRNPDCQLHKKMLLVMQSHLCGEVKILTDMAFHVILDWRAPRPPEMHLLCRPIWRKARARTRKEFIGGLIKQRERLLDKIEAALQWLDDDTYGIREGRDRPIPEAWLLAAPYATRCALCHPQRRLR